MSHGCAYMRPGWDLEACCFWPFLEHSSCDPPPQVAESEVSTGPLYGGGGQPVVTCNDFFLLNGFGNRQLEG